MQGARRLEDLATVYVVYAGALFMVAMLSLPFVMLALAATYKLAILVGGLSFCAVVTGVRETT